jgi:acetyltransferase-like isoleucine patch superfamily enzyme
MSDIYSKEELLNLGFKFIGKGVFVSKDARFFAITGELGEGVRIDAYSILTGHIVLGRNVHISPFCFLSGTGGTIRMGSNSGVSAHVSVFTKSVDYSKQILADAPKLTGNVSIGDYSVVGSGSTIMPGSKIGKNVSIGCNCVINGPVQKGTILVSRGIGLIALSKRRKTPK